MNEAISQAPAASVQANHPYLAGSIQEHLNRLGSEHRFYSQRLESLLARPWLSEEEKLEEVRLKKLKLRLKDEMETLRRSAGYDVGPGQQIA
jgi:hypothetical protein